MSSDGLQLFPSHGTTSRSPARDRLRRFTDRWHHRPPTIAEIADVDYLLAVHDVLRQHGGPAPGVDGVTFKDLSRSELAGTVASMAAAIKKGTYVPHRHRQVFIPKANGKMRELNLPILADRVVGAAMNYALSPYLEQKFHDRSMGFRPNRGTWTLFAMLEMDMERTACTVLTCDDVMNAFPSVKIDLAMDSFRRLLADPALLRLIEAVMRGAKGNTLGLSQGCPFSPLAMNVLLTFAHDRVVDELFQQCTHHTIPSPLPGGFRYADNLGYLTPTVSEGHQILTQVNQQLQRFDFQLKGEPGVPVDLREGGVELLGLQVSLDGRQMRYALGSKAWQHLDNLAQAHKTDNPPQVARQVIAGWLPSLGPVFENRTDDGFFVKIQQIATHHGFREIHSRKHLKHLAQKAGNQWRTYRQGYREGRGVKGTGRVVKAVV